MNRTENPQLKSVQLSSPSSRNLTTTKHKHHHLKKTSITQKTTPTQSKPIKTKKDPSKPRPAETRPTPPIHPFNFPPERHT